MSPLQECARPLGYILLPTVEQGGCGLDAMAFWDGAERMGKTWNALRPELAGALEVGAEDPVWQAALAASGEISPAVAIAANISAAGPPSALARAPTLCLRVPKTTPEM